MSAPRPWKVQQRGTALLRLMSVNSTSARGWRNKATVALVYLIPRCTGILTTHTGTRKNKLPYLTALNYQKHQSWQFVLHAYSFRVQQDFDVLVTPWSQDRCDVRR